MSRNMGRAEDGVSALQKTAASFLAISDCQSKCSVMDPVQRSYCEPHYLIVRSSEHAAQIGECIFILVVRGLVAVQ